MHDLRIVGGFVVDGSGSARVRADVAVDGDRVVAIGADTGPARRTIRADGRCVVPGFVDVHTHLDVQGFWDSSLSPSPLHGVTTVVGGNCGFTVAPLDPDTAKYLMPMLAKVEGMPLSSLQSGVPWDWSSTGDFLDRLDGKLALNAGFMVGHSALRCSVMRDAALERHATADELEQMKSLLRQGLASGGMGFSSTWSESHNGHDGRPVPSRHASPSEMLGLAAVCREFEGTSLEFLATPSRPFDPDVAELMVQMTCAAQRPLNWNIITANASNLEFWLTKLELGDVARERGGKIVGLVIPESPPGRLSFLSGFVLDMLPGWQLPMALPLDEKLALLRSPDGRQRLEAGAASAPPHRRELADWGAKRIIEAFAPETQKFVGRIVADIAREQGRSPFDALVDIVCADDLRTTFSNVVPEDTAADWEARAAIWRDPRAVVGASDAGAHLDMLALFSYSTTLLARGVRERGLLSLEEAVRLLTKVPADLYGLRDRGTIAVGARADLVVLDEATVGPTEVRTAFDLPGGAGRLFAGANGVDHVLVNGQPVVEAGVITQRRPGTLLRSGRDTATPSLA